VRLSVGVEGWLDELAGGGQARQSDGVSGVPVQVGQSGVWRLTTPVRIAASPRDIVGSLWLVRAGRPFEDDEIALIGELLAKAELAATEIIAHQMIREQAEMAFLRKHCSFVLQGPVFEVKGHPGGNLTATVYLDRVTAGNN
jgi:hypothetical protein